MTFQLRKNCVGATYALTKNKNTNKIRKQPRRRCGRRWGKKRVNDRPSLFAGMCSLSLFAEKGDELTCCTFYIANGSPRDR